MRRLATIAALIAVGAVLGGLAYSEQQANVRRIGFLGASATLQAVFRATLADRGFVEGRNIVIESRWPANGQLDLLPATAEALAGSKPDVIVAIGATAARAATRATKDVPIVFEIVVDPVATGLIGNRERPGGNATGFTSFDPQQARQQMEILKQAIPGLARIALLSDAGAVPDLLRSNVEAAEVLGLQVQTILVARSPNPDFAAALQAAKDKAADAVIVISTPVTVTHRKTIVELANKLRLPTLSPRDHEDASPLISYGNSFAESTRRAARYVARILEGDKPGDLPVETVSQPELIFNLATARTLGLRIPRELLSRATRINE